MSSRKIRFKTVTLRNFLSYGNAPTTVDLDRSGTIQIQGRNLDDTQNGVGGNGVGKTSLINAIVYCLYGEVVSSDVKVDDVVNDRNNKECVVSLTFDIDDDSYELHRYRKMKTGPEGNYIEIFKNGDKDHNLAKASLPETNKWIEAELLDMPKELFTRLVVYDADEPSFFKLPAAKQRDLMENLFQLTILSEKAEALKEQQKDVKGKLTIEENTIETLKIQIERHNEQIEKAKARIQEWENKRKHDLDDYRSDFLTLSKIDIEQQRQLLKQIDELETQIKQTETDIATLQQQEVQHNRQREELSEKINLQLESVRSNFTIKRQELRAKIVEIESEISQERERLEAQQANVLRLAKEAKQHQDKINTLQSTIDRLEGDITKHRLQIATLEKNECPECHQQMPDASTNIQKRLAQIDELTNQIGDTNKTINEHEAQRDKLIDESEQHNEAYQAMLKDNKQTILCQHVATYKQSIDDLNEEEQQAVAARKETLNEEIEQIESAIADNRQAIRVLEQQQQQKREMIANTGTIAKSETQLIRLEAEKENIAKQIADMEQLVNPHLEVMQDLINSQHKDIDYETINEYKSLIDHQQFLIKALTDKKSFIRKKLISKRLPYLNERLSIYLRDMGLPYTVEFNSDLTPSISKRGRQKSFGVLSHGQKARVNFALSFAFRDVLERMHRKINICLLDEVLDKALCSVGANSAVQLINEKAREDNICIFVITHKSELATKFKHHVTVTMENGFSSIDGATVTFNDADGTE